MQVVSVSLTRLLRRRKFELRENSIAHEDLTPLDIQQMKK